MSVGYSALLFMGIQVKMKTLHTGGVKFFLKYRLMTLPILKRSSSVWYYKTCIRQYACILPVNSIAVSIENT